MGLDTIGLMLAVLMGIVSFMLGRRISRHFARRRAEREAAAARAGQSRQVRRAEERRRRG